MMEEAMRAIKVAAVMAAVVLTPAVTLAVAPPWISDETRGMSCGAGYGLAKVECAGRYCDNIKLTCAPYIDRPLQREPAGAYWTKWFSEERTGDVVEGFNFPVLADPYSIAIGMQCRGSYCDDIRLRMLPLSRTSSPTLDSKLDQPDCRLSASFSEEAGAGSPSPNPPVGQAREIVRRVGCAGGYCDNLRVEWCKVFNR
jgi:hypothetical protein